MDDPTRDVRAAGRQDVAGSLLGGYAAILAFVALVAMVGGIFALGDGSRRLVQVGWGTIAAGGATFLGCALYLGLARGAR